MTRKRRSASVKWRGVSLQRRLTKSGVLQHNVRWNEVIDGVVRPKSKSFKSEIEANAFKARCQAKLGIAQSAASLMTTDALPIGNLQSVIEEYLAYLRNKCTQRSRYAENVGYALRPLPEELGWHRTIDIPPNGYDQIVARYGQDKTHAKRSTQRQLGYLIRWAQGRYRFRDGILDCELTKHETSPYYIWTDAEYQSIMRELTAPMREVIIKVEWGAKRCRAERRKAHNDFFIRRALIPVVWIQMRWGLRPTEAALLRVQDWKSHERLLTIPAEITKKKYKRQFVVDRETAFMLDILIRDRDGDDVLFYTYRWKPWSRYLMSRQFRVILKRLKLRGSLYSCRHYAATTLAEEMPGQLRKVMRITGHKSLKHLEPYLQEKEDRRAVVPAAYEENFDAVLQRAPSGNGTVSPQPAAHAPEPHLVRILSPTEFEVQP